PTACSWAPSTSRRPASAFPRASAVPSGRSAVAGWCASSSSRRCRTERGRSWFDGAMSERRYVPLRAACGEPHSCPAPVRRRVLAATALFGDLGERDIADVGERMTARSWPAGEYLYVEGDPADDLYVLASGRAKMTRTDADG